MLGSLFLALSLAQAYQPPNAPPCAAANIPGCLPGYRMTYDAYGRRVYVYDPQSPQAVPPPSQPPLAEPPAIPPPPPEQPQPPAESAPAPEPPRAAPPPPPGWYRPLEPPRREVVGLVWMPFAGTTVGGFDQPDTFDHMGEVALELRAIGSGARARFGFEYGPLARVAEVALKYDFNDWGVIRPFFAIGVGAGNADPDPRWRAAVAGSVGVDVFVTRQVFFTAELRGRRFTDLGASATEPASTELVQTAALFGLGLYL